VSLGVQIQPLLTRGLGHDQVLDELPPRAGDLPTERRRMLTHLLDFGGRDWLGADFDVQLLRGVDGHPATYGYPARPTPSARSPSRRPAMVTSRGDAGGADVRERARRDAARTRGTRCTGPPL
jgi:hypothetical protein